ncbi:Brp/Blh family beta-carotene 15,15'-dioxygenase [Pedobacter westerhofensis]|uniref:Brp/Blh family beta-carotene 15,15'-dioxygenase n=1 Tax=Pedobacter westerhofensis TaxID=425512 RepID=UPI0021CFE919|nr:Brp/Blh family beta-carotene 15,15'-dioxygenase [Pedobacter westerhofensis]
MISGLILSGFNAYIYPVPEQAQFIFFLSGVIVLGIPHGGADLLVAGQHSRNTNHIFSKAKFNLLYLGNIFLFLLVMIWFPLTGLVLFLLLAAYHFGETDLQCLNIQTLPGDIFIFVYGLLILAVILLPDFHHVCEGLAMLHPDSGTVQILTWMTDNSTAILGGILAIFICSGTLFFAYHQHLLKRHWLQLILLVILIAIVYELPLMLSFSFYFVIWHSLISLKKITVYLSAEEPIHPIFLVKEIFKNSIIALLGVAVLGWAAFAFLDHNDLVLYTILGLAVLTAPHMKVMHQMYRQLNTP